jgi:hypothetical protein
VARAAARWEHLAQAFPPGRKNGLLKMAGVAYGGPAGFRYAMVVQ